MILTCPQCSTRYQADAAKFAPAGRNVRCAKCGHVWLQMPPQPEPEPELAIVEEAPVPPPPPRPPLPPPPPSVQAEPIPRPLAYAPRETYRAPEAVAPTLEAPPASPSAWPARAATAAGWATLALMVFLIGWTAVSFRRDVASIWPQSASLYKAIGLSVNATGIQFVGVTNRLEDEDGAHVLVVSGKLINNSARELPVPQIRIALTDAQRRELYHWPVVANVPTLRPGQSAPFLTRLANPPGAMHEVEVTFARADE
jgi:predicted Zn finger-like uncharacterized protein